MNKTILIADDDTNVLASLNFLLSEEGFTVYQASSPAEAFAAINQKPIDLLLTDLNFHEDTTSGKEGITLVERVNKAFPDLPIIVMTGWATVDIAVKTLKSGAKDFVQKPWKDEQLISSINTHIALCCAVKKAQSLSQHNKILSAENLPNFDSGIIARSEEMQSLVSTLKNLALSDMNILLTGENGTGKSLFAQFIHQYSARKDSDFVSVNMGAIAENLFESEMFGHTKGAFTDAKNDRIGRFEMAESGTLFLDELANIPISQQAKLLRVLEENQFEKVGSSRTQIADARIISATNADLNINIKNGSFRQDLYYRLNTVEIKIPALRERVADIKPLAESFLEKYAKKYNRQIPKLSTDAISQLESYAWPGNIRELSHLLERALFMCNEDKIQPTHLNLDPTLKTKSNIHHSNITLDEIEKQVLISRLDLNNGNVTETAKSLGLSRSGYYRRVQKYGLD